MLDVGIPARCVLMWAAWIAGVVSSVAAVVTERDDLGRLSLALIIMACTVTVLNDNAQTRALVRRLQREAWENETGNRIMSVP